MNIRDATDETLDAIVRKAADNARAECRARLQLIAREVADHQAAPRVTVQHRASDRAALFATIRATKGV